MAKHLLRWIFDYGMLSVDSLILLTDSGFHGAVEVLTFVLW